jgi:4-hydroxybutyrate dehydrogenase/sulfolactaldehyde 3-reductase
MRVTQVGFIGLGRMGRPMAKNLVKKGFRVLAYDVDPKALEEFSTAPLNELAASSEIIVTMLPNSRVVQEVVRSILPAVTHGALIMDMSTVAPETTDLLAEEAAALGIAYVDAPVGRLASHADRGESLFMVGASARDFERVKPLLEAMGTTIHHCGDVGAGTRTKLVNNYLAIVSCQTNAEALALSQRFGLSLEKTLEVLYGTTAINGQVKIAWPSKVLAGDVTPGFTVDLAHKDLTLIVESANAAGVPMPIGAAAREAFSTARARGFGMKDFSVMVDALCDLAGIQKPRLGAQGAEPRSDATSRERKA